MPGKGHISGQGRIKSWVMSVGWITVLWCIISVCILISQKTTWWSAPVAPLVERAPHVKRLWSPCSGRGLESNLLPFSECHPPFSLALLPVSPLLILRWSFLLRIIESESTVFGGHFSSCSRGPAFKDNNAICECFNWPFYSTLIVINSLTSE